MPENLLEKIFSCWFEFAGIEEETAIELASRHTDASSLPGGLGSFILNLWQRRPTRLFSLLAAHHPEQPQAWFSFLDLETRRLPLVLESNRYSDAQLGHLSKLATQNDEPELERLLKRFITKKSSTAAATRHGQPAVPLLIDSGNPSHPRVIFDRFSDDFSLFMRLTAESPVIAQHRRICELFMHKLTPEKLLMPLLPLMCLPFSGFSAEGNSFEMGLWVSLWLAAHSWPQAGNLCCTGTICCKSGRIGRVLRLDEKLNAALRAGFTTCLVPAEGFTAAGFAGDPRVIAINDLDELNDWLLRNTGAARQTHRIVSWLQSDRHSPPSQDFTAFFAEKPAIDIEPAIYWKHLLRQQPPERRLHRLKCLVREYCHDSHAETEKTLAFLPASLRYACLPWLLQELLREKPAAAESLYLAFSRKCAGSSPEIYQASRFLIEKTYFSLLSQPDFTNVRHRFPLLLWLFFREPSEMLLAFSLLKQLNGSEEALLQNLITLLERHAQAYVENTSFERIDARIMQKLLKKVDKETRFRPGPLLTVRKRLLYLWQAGNSFAATNNMSASGCCRRLLDLHLDLLTERTAPGFDLTTAFAAGPTAADAWQKMTKIPALQDLLHAVSSVKDSLGNQTRQIRGPNLFKNCKAAIQRKSPDLLWLPQPGSACLRAVMEEHWPELNFFGLVRQFTCNSYRTPASELREACLAYWAGTITSHCAASTEMLIKTKSYRHAGNLYLPFLVGWLRQKYLTTNVLLCTACRELLLIDGLPLDSLIWALLLPQKCMPCLKPRLLSRLSSAEPLSGTENLRRKHDIYLSLLQTLLEPERNSPDNSFWLCSLAECKKAPSQARRTVQALAPFYYLLTNDSRQAWQHVRNSRHFVNNSEFALAFLLRFTRLGKPDFRVQPVPELSLSVEKHLLDSLTLAYYHLFKPKLFANYILSEVDDLANLQVISL